MRRGRQQPAVLLGAPVGVTNVGFKPHVFFRLRNRKGEKESVKSRGVNSNEEALFKYWGEVQRYTADTRPHARRLEQRLRRAGRFSPTATWPLPPLTQLERERERRSQSLHSRSQPGGLPRVDGLGTLPSWKSWIKSHFYLLNNCLYLTPTRYKVSYPYLDFANGITPDLPNPLPSPLTPSSRWASMSCTLGSILVRVSRFAHPCKLGVEVSPVESHTLRRSLDGGSVPATGIEGLRLCGRSLLCALSCDSVNDRLAALGEHLQRVSSARPWSEFEQPSPRRSTI